MGQGGTENILIKTKEEAWLCRGWKSENWKGLEELQKVCSCCEVTWKTLNHYQ
jgi:hypothetical protein